MEPEAAPIRPPHHAPGIRPAQCHHVGGLDGRAEPMRPARPQRTGSRHQVVIVPCHGQRKRSSGHLEIQFIRVHRATDHVHRLSLGDCSKGIFLRSRLVYGRGWIHRFTIKKELPIRHFVQFVRSVGAWRPRRIHVGYPIILDIRIYGFDHNRVRPAIYQGYGLNIHGKMRRLPDIIIIGTIHLPIERVNVAVEDQGDLRAPIRNKIDGNHRIPTLGLDPVGRNGTAQFEGDIHAIAAITCGEVSLLEPRP